MLSHSARGRYISFMSFMTFDILMLWVQRERPLPFTAFLCVYTAFHCLRTVPFIASQQPAERSVYLRDQIAGMYCTSAFYIARSFAEMPTHGARHQRDGMYVEWTGLHRLLSRACRPAVHRGSSRFFADCRLPLTAAACFPFSAFRCVATVPITLFHSLVRCRTLLRCCCDRVDQCDAITNNYSHRLVRADERCCDRSALRRARRADHVLHARAGDGRRGGSRH